MFFAALAEVHQGFEPDPQDGFVITTADSDQGMIDIHDWRPVVLRSEHAREWQIPERRRNGRPRSQRSAAGLEEMIWF